VERLKPVLAGLREKNDEKVKKGDKDAKADKVFSWEEICGNAAGQGINLSTVNQFNGSGDDNIRYQNYGVCVSEVEIDVITGETEVLGSDLVYDCGKSLNPAVDVGQIEGGFVMGLGFFTCEEMAYDKEGKLVSNGTWEYKPPLAKNIPINFNVSLLKNAPFDKGIMNSKASGEPPMVLATSIPMAVRQAIASARKDAGLTGFFRLDAPCTPDAVQRACGVEHSQFTV